MRKIKNKILIGLLKINVVLAILSACALDSESNIPIIVYGASVTYLLLFTLANTKE